MNAPPTHAVATVPPPGSGWATGLGIVAIVYAVAGILVNGLGLVFIAFNEQAATAAAAGPAQWVFGGLAILLGTLLAGGAVGVLCRRRWGVRAMTAWVVARLLLLLVASGYAWLSLPQQVDAQMSMVERQVAEARSGGGGGSRGVRVQAGGGLDREAMLKWSKLAFVGGVLVTGAFPVATGWILSNRRRREEIAAWSG